MLRGDEPNAASARVRAIEYHLPETAVSNEDLKRLNPGWNMRLIESKTGVRSRRIARDGETAADLAFQAVARLLAAQGVDKESIDGILYCTQSPDHIMPPNSSLLHSKLGLSKGVMALDFNLACSGFVYGLAIARALIQSLTCRIILFVTADTYSKYLHPGDRATRTLFGDGAAATLVEGTHEGSGILDLDLATDGTGGDKFMIKAGGLRYPRSPETQAEKTDLFANVRTDENIYMDGKAVLEFAKNEIPASVRSILGRNGLAMEDLNLILFHQASGSALKILNEELGIPADRTFSNIENIGNTVSASLPILLKDAETAGVLSRGDLVLLVGFGVGFSWGTCLLKW